jgi:alanyl-tRNA synthetase
MTDRLYYTDAWLRQFSAAIVALEDEGKRVYLDRTAFYPTSGGQPHDTGRLQGVVVVDVIDEGERVAHVCETAVASVVGAAVDGVIDWDRRFDHMQQHTGQHLLSALLADTYGWPTVSVHFGMETNTVDVAAGDIDLATIAEIERRANVLIAEDHAVRVSFEDAASATGLRKASDRTGILRIVTIDGIDRGACGGTHVAQTGSIGGMLLRRAERTKGNTRLEFVCGLRAVARARADAALLTRAARLFSASPEALPTLVETQLQRTTELERDRKRLTGELAVFQARSRFEASTPNAAGVRFVQLPSVDGPVREAEALVHALLAIGDCVAVVRSPSTGGVMLGASESSGIDAGATLRAALVPIGGRGGGSPRVAQGNLPDPADFPQVLLALGFRAELPIPSAPPTHP